MVGDGSLVYGLRREIPCLHTYNKQRNLGKLFGDSRCLILTVKKRSVFYEGIGDLRRTEDQSKRCYE